MSKYKKKNKKSKIDTTNIGVDKINLDRKSNPFSKTEFSLYMQYKAAKIEVTDPIRIAKKDNWIVGKIFFRICELTFSPDSVFLKSKNKIDFIDSIKDFI